MENELSEEACNNVNWESIDMWEIDDIVPSDSIYDKEGGGDTVTFTYRLDSASPLGYSPMKQVVCPRFIGWISTYEATSLANKDDTTTPIAHISPYSFFVDVARGSRPMVAFAACPRSDEFTNSENDGEDDNANGAHWKDAQRDAEQTGVFCVNLVSEDLAWAMNASAAPLGKSLSEFRLMEGSSNGSPKRESDQQRRRILKPMPAPTVDAPFVPQSPMFMECRYIKTVKVPEVHKGDSMYSLILGEVTDIHIRTDCLESSADGGNCNDNEGCSKSRLSMDLERVRPVARLGYGQEYTVVLEHL